MSTYEGHCEDVGIEDYMHRYLCSFPNVIHIARVHKMVI